MFITIIVHFVFLFLIEDMRKAELNDVLHITGWGGKGPDVHQATSDILLAGQVFVTDIADCKTKSARVNGNQHVCCKSSDFDSCSGDSGGKFYVVVAVVVIAAVVVVVFVAAAVVAVVEAAVA